MAGNIEDRAHVSAMEKEGDQKDKNTWRGVTVLSVGSKLLAGIVAAR